MVCLLLLFFILFFNQVMDKIMEKHQQSDNDALQIKFIRFFEKTNMRKLCKPQMLCINNHCMLHHG